MVTKIIIEHKHTHTGWFKDLWVLLEAISESHTDKQNKTTVVS